MANSAMLLDLAFSDLEGQTPYPINFTTHPSHNWV